MSTLFMSKTLNTPEGLIQLGGPHFKEDAIANLFVQHELGFEPASLDLTQEELRELHKMIGNYLEQYYA